MHWLTVTVFLFVLIMDFLVEEMLKESRPDRKAGATRYAGSPVKVPADACPLFLREECVIVDIKPKELIARGMPQCTLTQ